MEAPAAQVRLQRFMANGAPKTHFSTRVLVAGGCALAAVALAAGMWGILSDGAAEAELRAAALAAPGIPPPRTSATAARRAAARELRLRRAVAAAEDADRTSSVLVLAVAVLLAVSFAALAAALVRSRREVAVRRRTELELLRKAALTDSLTGLGNHRASQEDLRRALESHRRSGQPLTVMRVDLRGLKQVNDTLGHQAGDARLCALADGLRETGRQIDTAYRTGGDEFTIILPGTRAWDAFQFAQRLRTNALAGDPPISFSCGITEFIGLEDVPTLVRRADLALIDAKRSKRAAVIYADGLDSGPVERDENHELEHYKLFATALARAVDTKDSGTRNHCETVAEICVLIARELGLSPSHCEKLRMAGLLHDVGKIGIADTILGKPGELNEVERATMRTHVTLGHNIVSAAGLEEAAEWILHHHERLDGQGYPNGLGGDHIPFASKIIHVADSFEAITADRPYRKGRSPREALVELERHAGTQFDPACVEALSKVLAANDELESPEEAADDQEHRDEFSGMAAARELLYDHYPANRAASA